MTKLALCTAAVAHWWRKQQNTPSTLIRFSSITAILIENDLCPDRHFSSIRSEMISIRTSMPENTYHMTIHTRWECVCRNKHVPTLQMVA